MAAAARCRGNRHRPCRLRGDGRRAGAPEEPDQVLALRRRRRNRAREEVRRESIERLGESGVAATGDTGESDPFAAIYDALQTFDADRIVLFKHARGQRYREDVDPAAVRERFGRPVDQATVS